MILDRLTIELPWPDKMLFPNQKARGNFRRHQDQREAARRDGFHAARLALGRNTIQIGMRTPVRITFAMPDRRNRDWDGLAGAIKHHMDGIADALGVNDRVFRPVTVDDCLDEARRGFVLVEIGGQR